MSLTNKEKVLFGIFLDELRDHIVSFGHNGLTKEMKDALTKEEWNDVSRRFHQWNGDPQNHNDETTLMDFQVLYYLRKQLGI